MKFTLKEICDLVNGKLIGSAQTFITGISGIKEAKEGDITFLSNPKYYPLLEETKASAIIVSESVEFTAKPLIKTSNPSLAFAKAVNLFFPQTDYRPKGCHSLAYISPKAKIGKNVAIGPFAVIEDGASIDDNTVIYPAVFVGNGVKIGKDCLIYSNVSLRERVEIGNRVIIHCGTVIGSDGFGFAEVDGAQEKIPQVGIVVIGDNVEIGANVTIDRARFDKTVIGSGTKIDNLVQIAHNVIIKENCIVVAQAGISGSTIIEKGAILAGQAGIVGHITIGEGAIIAARAGVTKSVPAKTMVSGYPAKPHNTAKKINACVQNLPNLYKKVAELESKIKKLEENR